MQRAFPRSDAHSTTEVSENRLEHVAHDWWRVARRWLFRAVVYLILADVGFVFLFPVIYMVTTSFKSAEDLNDPTVVWLASGLSSVTQNYVYAFKALDMLLSGRNSIEISVISAVLQTVSCGVVGYAFARIPFPGRGPLFAVVLLTFLVPPETIIVPLFILYKNLGWIDDVYYRPFIVPSMFAMGLKGPLFIMIYRQFFRGMPYELEDAARIDGAGAFKTFWFIMLPLARPAMLVTLLFSLVWHWNDYFEPLIYLNRTQFFTLPMRLSALGQSLNDVTNGQGSEFYNEAFTMAACFLVITPILVIYLFTQRYFVTSIDRTGLVE